MPKRSAMYPQGYGAYAGGVGTLPQAQGNVLAPPGTFPKFGLDWSSPHTWAWTWFALALAYVFIVYQAHGGRHGGIL